MVSPWKGNAFRFASLRRPMPEDILSGIGAYRIGGRWNAPGSFRTVYGSTTPAVAVDESNSTASYYGIEREVLQPRLMVAIELKLSFALDLTQSAVRRKLHVSLANLLDEDWRRTQDVGQEALTQAIGRAAFNTQIECLIVPSAKVTRGVNLVVFPENLQADSIMQIWDENDLRHLSYASYE